MATNAPLEHANYALYDVPAASQACRDATLI